MLVNIFDGFGHGVYIDVSIIVARLAISFRMLGSVNSSKFLPRPLLSSAVAWNHSSAVVSPRSVPDVHVSRTPEILSLSQSLQ